MIPKYNDPNFLNNLIAVNKNKIKKPKKLDKNKLRITKYFPRNNTHRNASGMGITKSVMRI